MLAFLLSFSISIFPDSLAFIHSPFLREPFPEHPYWAVLSETHGHTVPLPSCVVCAVIVIISVSVHGHEGLSSYSDPEQYPHRLPNLWHPLPDAEQKWQSKNSCWMTTWVPILEIKTRLTKVRSSLQSALLPSPACSIFSLFLALFSQMISHSFGGLGTSYSRKQNLVQCLYL